MRQADDQQNRQSAHQQHAAARIWRQPLELDGHADPEQQREQGHGLQLNGHRQEGLDSAVKRPRGACDRQELFKDGNAKLVHDINREHAEQGDASEDIDGIDAFTGIDGSRGRRNRSNRSDLDHGALSRQLFDREPPNCAILSTSTRLLCAAGTGSHHSHSSMRRGYSFHIHVSDSSLAICVAVRRSNRSAARRWRVVR